MMTIVWSRGAFAIFSTASVIALARSSFCCCVRPGYIKTLTMGMKMDQTFPIQESLVGRKNCLGSLQRGEDQFFLTRLASCAREIRDTPQISIERLPRH